MRDFSPKWQEIIEAIYKENSPDDFTSALFQEGAKSIEQLQSAERSELASKGFRLNLNRLQVAYCVPGSTVSLSSVADFVVFSRYAELRTRFIDDLPALLDECSDLKDLFFFKSTNCTIVEEILEEGRNCSCLSGIISFTTKMTDNAVEDEVEDLGKQAAEFMDWLLTSMSRKAVKLFMETAKSFIDADSKVYFPII